MVYWHELSKNKRKSRPKRCLPASKRAIGMPMLTVTATFAPAVGPLIGGWLTDNYGWPFVFYINVIPGLLLITAVLVHHGKAAHGSQPAEER
jgi:MFS family permease